MPIFTRQHYKTIALLLYKERPNRRRDTSHDDKFWGWVAIVNSFADRFYHDNPNFNQEKFLKACGMEE